MAAGARPRERKSKTKRIAETQNERQGNDDPTRQPQPAFGRNGQPGALELILIMSLLSPLSLASVPLVFRQISGRRFRPS